LDTGGNLNTARYNSAVFGSQTAAITAGGGSASPVGAPLTATESYNGTSWTTSPGTLNTGRRVFAGVGTQYCWVSFCWIFIQQTQEQQNHGMVLAWTSVNSMNTARLAIGGSGVQTSAIAFGGTFRCMDISNRTLEWHKLDNTSNRSFNS
jgi:hypothetical protein